MSIVDTAGLYGQMSRHAISAISLVLTEKQLRSELPFWPVPACRRESRQLSPGWWERQERVRSIPTTPTTPVPAAEAVSWHPSDVQHTQAEHGMSPGSRCPGSSPGPKATCTSGIRKQRHPSPISKHPTDKYLLESTAGQGSKGSPRYTSPSLFTVLTAGQRATVVGREREEDPVTV